MRSLSIELGRIPEASLFTIANLNFRGGIKKATVVHSNHFQRSPRARLNFWRSIIPSPPSFFGLQINFQFTKDRPRVASGLECHKKLQRSLSICLIVQFLSLNTVSMKIGMAKSTTLTSAQQKIIACPASTGAWRQPCQ